MTTKSNSELFAVIMAGGAGRRFWPLSRRHFPKQVLPIFTGKALINQTVERLKGFIPEENIYIITSADHESMIRELISELPPENIIGEPEMRDTAGCIGLAAKIIKWRNPNSSMLVMPADHIIKDKERFIETIKIAKKSSEEFSSEKNILTTFGIKPTRAATEYGYIKKGKLVSKSDKVHIHNVEEFKEKPDLENAKIFLESEEYYWNSGIFFWHVDAVLYEIEKSLPKLNESLNEIEKYLGTDQEEEIIKKEYPKFSKISIDYGVMEKAKNVQVVEARFDWDDVGSWLALERFFTPDSNGNIIIGSLVQDSAKKNIVYSKDHLIALSGIEDSVIIHTPDATLISKKDSLENLKRIVENIEREGFGESL